jgi:hypothetical protein
LGLEFVALAQQLGVPLVTKDRRILRDFRKTATTLESYGGGPQISQKGGDKHS